MPSRLDLLAISALALYRAWRFVARDAITAKWRERLFNRWPPTAERAAGMMTWDANLRQNVYTARPGPTRRTQPKVSLIAASIACPWCAPTIAAAALTAAVDASFGLVWPFLWFGALCALVGILGRVDGS